MYNGNLKIVSEVVDLEKKKVSLSEDIRQFGITFSELEDTVKNHEGNKVQFETLQQQKEQVSIDIISLKAISLSLNNEIEELNTKKNILLINATHLQGFIEQNKNIQSEIEKNSTELRRIQDDILKFTSIKNEIITSTQKIKDDINTTIKVASNSLPKPI